MVLSAIYDERDFAGMGDLHAVDDEPRMAWVEIQREGYGESRAALNELLRVGSLRIRERLLGMKQRLPQSFHRLGVLSVFEGRNAHPPERTCVGGNGVGPGEESARFTEVAALVLLHGRRGESAVLVVLGPGERGDRERGHEGKAKQKTRHGASVAWR
ncbi:MAG: hypothetical protein RL385_758 [Pseudomonadota bacterium]